MGPSGSGKTTLLDVLSGRKTVRTAAPAPCCSIAGDNRAPQVGTTEGSILFAGSAPSRAFLRRFTVRSRRLQRGSRVPAFLSLLTPPVAQGYVEQTDTLIGSLTVREMLHYTALLKRPVQEPAEAKVAVVESAIATLGLTRCADVRIGGALVKGISGGQAKRVNIGLALVSSPRVLFLDGAACAIVMPHFALAFALKSTPRPAPRRADVGAGLVHGQ